MPSNHPWSPGPWEVEKLNPQQVRMKGGICVAFASEGVIAGAGGTYRIDHAEAKANARLIAAAPELVEALSAYRDALDAEMKRFDRNIEPPFARCAATALSIEFSALFQPILARVEGGGDAS